jgi:hypothetical protein
VSTSSCGSMPATGEPVMLRTLSMPDCKGGSRNSREQGCKGPGGSQQGMAVRAAAGTREQAGGSTASEQAGGRTLQRQAKLQPSQLRQLPASQQGHTGAP